MKNLITSVIVLISALGFSQSKSINGLVVKETPKVENVALTVTVDSAEEIESTFTMEDVKDIIETSEENETLSFKIICNGDTMSNGKKSYMSYKIEGNSDESEKFLKGVEKIRNSAIKYYNNKN